MTEKLPEPETYILVSFDNFTLPDIATYRVDDDGRGAFYQGDEDYTYLSVGFYVNAWMPLPEPYRSEVEEKRLEDVMRCPYCNYIPECNEQTCAGCKIYEDFLDDRNAEGYPDPTAARAIKAADRPPEEIIMFRKMIKALSVICHVRVLGKVTLVDKKGRRW